jgi:hypothetical protein
MQCSHECDITLHSERSLLPNDLADVKYVNVCYYAEGIGGKLKQMILLNPAAELRI